jgi:hypothetical protein
VATLERQNSGRAFRNRGNTVATRLRAIAIGLFAVVAVATVLTGLAIRGCVLGESGVEGGNSKDGLVLTWDFSADAGLSGVGWPPNLATPFWDVRGPGTLDLVLATGEHFKTFFDEVQVGRDGNQVASLRILFASEDAKSAYARAKQFAIEHGCDGDENAAELDRWWTKVSTPRETGGRSYAILLDRNKPPRRSVEIRRDFGDLAKPWYVVLGVSVAKQPTAADRDLEAIQKMTFE